MKEEDEEDVVGEEELLDDADNQVIVSSNRGIRLLFAAERCCRRGLFFSPALLRLEWGTWISTLSILSSRLVTAFLPRGPLASWTPCLSPGFVLPDVIGFEDAGDSAALETYCRPGGV